MDITPETIKALRLRLGLSAPQFIDALGIKGMNPDLARQKVYRWESGKRQPSTEAKVLIRTLWLDTFKTG